MTRLRSIFGESHGQLDLQLLGKVLLHAALVGLAAGGVGTAFVIACEFATSYLLEGLAGYHQLYAAGEHTVFRTGSTFRPLVFVLLPALGGLASGILCHFLGKESFGGGTDVVIDAFHNGDTAIRKRTPVVKLFASIFTLSTGGAGGREGPTMLIGGSIGSLIGRALRVTERERRVLLVAGTAAGMSAVFRTPLGAAILAVEVLHRDDFESDALVPSVFASVVGYSVSVSVLGESTLFAHAPRYPFIPAHLPLYALLALVICLSGALFIKILYATKGLFGRLPIPSWAKPGVGGLALGLLVLPILLYFGPQLGRPGQGLGLLGGGYGSAQLAITGSPWFSSGWRTVEILAIFALVKMLASSFTVGSGGSAGDFGPSLVIGALIGGSFGHAAQLLTGDPRIDPGAFALVGMGTFYGGVAHVPLAALVMVCELAGSYDLLVPLMLSGGVAFVLLRNSALYKKQVTTKRMSPAHRNDLILDVLRGIRVSEVFVEREFLSFDRSSLGPDIARKVAASEWQDTFPVMDDDGTLVGIMTADPLLRLAASDPGALLGSTAASLMSPPFSVRADADLHAALDLLLEHQVREVPVTDQSGRIVGFLDEAEVTRMYQEATNIAVPG